MQEDIQEVKVHEQVGEEQTALIHHYQKDNEGNWFEIFGSHKKKRVRRNRIIALIYASINTDQFIEIGHEVSQIL